MEDNKSKILNKENFPKNCENEEELLCDRKMKVFLFVAITLFVSTEISWINASIIDYIWPSKQTQYLSTSNVGGLSSVPFELEQNNENFLRDVSKVLGKTPSNLDFCQHRVVLNLRKNCNSLTNEDLGKLAVEFMNCHNQIAGREVFECTEKMSLKDCISGLSSDAWTTYNQFLGKAQSICLLIRQDQFRALAELTVNKLMESTHGHLHDMEGLQILQKQFKQATIASFDEMAENNLKLVEKQMEILRLSEIQTSNLLFNSREIMHEKNIIKEWEMEIQNILNDFKEQLDEERLKIGNQNEYVKKVHDNLNSDMGELHKSIDRITKELQKMNNEIVEQNQNALKQIEGTIAQLKEAKNIVQTLSKDVIQLTNELDGRMEWLTKLFGGTENMVIYLPMITAHILYLLVGMTCMAFVNTDILNRAAFLSVVSLHLISVLQGILEMDLVLLSELVALVLLTNVASKMFQKIDWINLFTVQKKELDKEKNNFLKKNNRIINGTSYNHLNNHRSEMNIHSRRSYLGSRPTTPVPSIAESEDDRHSERSSRTLNTASDNRCNAVTIRGNQCQMPVSNPNTIFCHIHRASTGRD